MLPLNQTFMPTLLVKLKDRGEVQAKACRIIFFFSRPLQTCFTPSLFVSAPHPGPSPQQVFVNGKSMQQDTNFKQLIARNSFIHCQLCSIWFSIHVYSYFIFVHTCILIIFDIHWYFNSEIIPTQPNYFTCEHSFVTIME